MEKKKILVIDDEFDFSQTVKMNLEQTGQYIVEIVNDGKEAVSSAEIFKPDLIFLDIIMPGIDGTEIMQKLKSNPEIRDIPVVFLTALISEAETASRGNNIGGQSFLAKPVSKEQLIDCINKYI